MLFLKMFPPLFPVALVVSWGKYAGSSSHRSYDDQPDVARGQFHFPAVFIATKKLGKKQKEEAVLLKPLKNGKKAKKHTCTTEPPNTKKLQML